VYKGVPMHRHDAADEKPKRRNPFWWLGRRVKKAREKAKAEETDEESEEEPESKSAAP
jgi:hypothetical protein